MTREIPSPSASGTFLIGGDVPVHRLGYGTMRLVGEGAWGEPADPAEAKRVLRRAVELGVTLIDTADAYGPEIAERLIGEALAPYPPGIVIATKGGITRQGPAKTEYVGRAGYLIQCVEMSLRRLKLERIDLYQLHRIDPRTPLEESLGALKRMQEQGKIRHIGLDEVTPAEVEEARKYIEVVTVQNRYSLGDRRHEEMLNWCQQQGIGFLPWYPNAGGTQTHLAGDGKVGGPWSTTGGKPSWVGRRWERRHRWRCVREKWEWPCLARRLMCWMRMAIRLPPAWEAAWY